MGLSLFDLEGPSFPSLVSWSLRERGGGGGGEIPDGLLLVFNVFECGFQFVFIVCGKFGRGR